MAVSSQISTPSRMLRMSGPAGSAVHRALRYRTPDTVGRTHLGLPSPWVTLVLSMAGPIPVGIPHGSAIVEQRFDTLVGGLHTRSVLLPQREAQVGAQLDVHPFASRALFGVPAGELSSTVIELSQLLGPAAIRLSDQAQTAGDGGVLPYLQSWVNDRMSDHPTRIAPEVRQAWRLLIRSRGRLRVAEIAAEVGWSRRHLTDQLRRETGLGAKDLARVVRFQTAVGAVRSGVGVGLAEIAAGCGYADQAHMSGEWREFAGCSPREWMTAELPHLQALV